MLFASPPTRYGSEIPAEERRLRILAIWIAGSRLATRPEVVAAAAMNVSTSPLPSAGRPRRRIPTLGLPERHFRTPPCPAARTGRYLDVATEAHRTPLQTFPL